MPSKPSKTAERDPYYRCFRFLRPQVNVMALRPRYGWTVASEYLVLWLNQHDFEMIVPADAPQPHFSAMWPDLLEDVKGDLETLQEEM